jgi:hypothetical protein
LYDLLNHEKTVEVFLNDVLFVPKVLGQVEFHVIFLLAKVVDEELDATLVVGHFL